MRVGYLLPVLPLLVAAASVAPTEMVLDGVSVSELATVAFRDLERVPYTLSPEVYGDTRFVSVRITGKGASFHSNLVAYLSDLGYVVTLRGGVYAVGPKPEVEKPKPPRFAVVYRPSYRDPGYLVDEVSSMLPECEFASRRGVSVPRGAVVPASSSASAVGSGAAGQGPQGGRSVSEAPVSQPVPASYSPSSAYGQIDRVSDTVVAYCTEVDGERLHNLLGQLDVPEGELVVRATLFEVTSSKADGSALQLAASVLGGRLGLTFGSASSLADNLTIGNKSLSVVISALGSDSRFRSLSSPAAHARSGTSATFQSGEEVPVLGAVSYPGAGNSPVQSVQYRDAGVIFKVTPTKREKVIALDVQQELSSFVQTTTGVNQSPTLTKRSLQSSLSVAPGDVVILGGLVSDQVSKTTDLPWSFLPSWLRSDNDTKSRSEIIMVLQVVVGDVAPSVGGHLVGEAVP